MNGFVEGKPVISLSLMAEHYSENVCSTSGSTKPISRDKSPNEMVVTIVKVAFRWLARVQNKT